MAARAGTCLSCNAARAPAAGRRSTDVGNGGVSGQSAADSAFEQRELPRAHDVALDPHALLFTLHRIEKRFGRDRAHEQRWGPRTLDLDLIAYDEMSIDTPDLTLPHPRLFERAFVLVPLAEIAPDRVIAGRTVREALGNLSTDGIERLPDRD